MATNRTLNEVTNAIAIAQCRAGDLGYNIVNALEHLEQDSDKVICAYQNLALMQMSINALYYYDPETPANNRITDAEAEVIISNLYSLADCFELIGNDVVEVEITDSELCP